MRSSMTVLAVVVLSATSARGARGQSTPAEGCDLTTAAVRPSCLVAAQAAASTQAWLAIVAAGGNPTPGTASAAGLHLGVLPRVGASLTARLVGGHMPDLREARIEPTDAVRFGQNTAASPALSATATVELGRGRTLAPTIGGIGSVELVGTAGWAALPAPDGDLGGGASALTYGGGARIGLLRESFGVPGVAASVLYHRVGRMRSGRTCPSVAGTFTEADGGLSVDQGVCVGESGDVGAYALDVGSWSARGVVAKHLLGLGLAAGLGYDRSSSAVDLEARAARGDFAPSDLQYARVRGAHMTEGRWSAFVDGSYSILAASVAAEAGWLAGADAIAGYPQASSDYDPRGGSFFGSVGLRVAL